MIKTIKTIFQKAQWSYILLYVIPLSLVFYATLYQLFGITNSLFNLLLSTRAISIIVLSLLGFLMARGNNSGSLSKIALLFASYCFLITFIQSYNSDLIAIGATIFFWPITLWIGEKSRYSKETFELSALIVSVVCNLMSITTIVGRSSIEIMESLEYSQSIGAINSIYLVLSTFPFIFLIPNRELKIGFMILPLLAFLVSGKTTCIAASLISVCYFFYKNIKNSRNRLTIFLLVITTIIVIIKFFSSFVDYEALLSGFNDDIYSGGNGRLDIIHEVLERYSRKDFLTQVFGSGYSAVAIETPLSAHNDFLEVLYDYGIVGFTLFAVFWINLVKKRRNLSINTDIRLVYDISLIIYMSSCLASNFIIQQINMLFFALLWGTIDKYSATSNK